MLKNQEDQTRAKLEEERKKAELAAQWTVAVGESIEPT